MSDTLRLLRLFRPQASWMLAGVAASTTVVLANVGLLALSGWFIAAMALAGLGRMPVEAFAPAAAIRALAILRTGGRYGERLVTHEATLRLRARLRTWVFARLEPLAPAALRPYRGGDLLSRLRADVDGLDTFYLRIVAPVVAAALGTAAMLAFLHHYVRSVALVDALALTAAGIGLPLAAQRLGRGPGERVVALRSDLRAAVSDTARSLGELLVYGAQERQDTLMSGLGRAIVTQRRRQAWIDGAAAALSGFVANGAMWAALVLLVPLVQARALPAPDLPMIALLVLAGFEAVAPLPLAFQGLGETLAAARRIFAIVDAEPAVLDPPGEPCAPERFDLRVEGLRMRYSADAPWAIDGLDLHIPQGGAVGLVGESGSGKTSLVNVLLRFFEHQEGRIEVGGVPLRRLQGDTMRGLCAVVAQRTHVFNASIRDNLLLARPEANDRELLAALASADLLEEVRAMPNGLDTVVGEMGSRLSGGQARRLTIARAFLKNAPILLLDEPTEGLDAASETRVLQALEQLMVGRTTVLISHRREVMAQMLAIEMIATVYPPRMHA